MLRTYEGAEVGNVSRGKKKERLRSRFLTANSRKKGGFVALKVKKGGKRRTMAPKGGRETLFTRVSSW